MTKYYSESADLTDVAGRAGYRLEVTASISSAADTFTEAAEFDPRKPFNLSVGGSGWVADVRLQRSYDLGSTWLTVWTTDEPAEELVDTIGEGVLWRLGCLADDYTSGTIPVRLSQ